MQLAAGVDAGEVGNQLQIWSVEERTQLALVESHRGRAPGTNGGIIGSLLYSHDGRKLLSASWDGTVKTWDARRPRLLRTIRHEHPVVRADLSLDGRVLASAQWMRAPGETDGPYSSCTTQIRDLATGEIRKTLEERGLVIDVRFTPDGESLLTAGPKRLVRIWSVATGKKTADLEQSAHVRALRVSPDGQYLAVACQDRRIAIWTGGGTLRGGERTRRTE